MTCFVQEFDSGFNTAAPLPATARYPLEFYAHIAKGGKAQSSVVTHLNGCITLTAPENGLLLSKRFVLNLLLKISIVRRGWHGSIDLQNINYKSIMQRRRISMEAIKRPLKKHKIRNYVETVKEGADNENFPDGVSRTIM